MKELLLTIGILCSTLAAGQTYFYVDNIGINPSAPTTTDNISVDLVGGLSSTGAYVVSASATVVGSVVTLTVNSADLGGLAVIVPHTETVQLGQLAAGTYTIVITGTATGDFAPQPEHVFTVSGGPNLPACDSLVIVSIEYSAFNDTVIELTVSNNSSVLFDYPGFILFDSNGDTLAMETVNYFGIGQGPQVHVLAIRPSATLPTGSFNGTLELWTGFYVDHPCTFNITEDLCPPGPCSDAIVYIENTGGAFVVSSFSWIITDSLANTVGAGQLQLGNQQYDTANVCLPPGVYTLSMTQPNASGGQLYFGMGTLSGATSEDFFVQGSTNMMDFGFYTLCIDGSTGLDAPTIDVGLDISIVNDMLSVSATRILGHVRIHDVQGRVLLEEVVNGSSTTIPLARLSSGCYVLSLADGSTHGVRFVKP